MMFILWYLLGPLYARKRRTETTQEKSLGIMGRLPGDAGESKEPSSSHLGRPPSSTATCHPTSWMLGGLNKYVGSQWGFMGLSYILDSGG